MTNPTAEDNVLNPGHEQVILKLDEDLQFEVDKGIASLIHACWHYGGQTVASCENNSEGKAWIQFLNPLAADDFLTGIFADGDTYWDGKEVDPTDWEWETVTVDGSEHINVTVYFPPELIELLTDSLIPATSIGQRNTCIKSSDLCGKNAVLLAGEGGYRIIGHSLRSHLRNPDSNKEKQIWVIREKKTKARGNNKKRPCVI